MSSLDYLLPTSTPGGEDWEWATVTSVSPLRIRIDGDSAPLAGSPDSLVAPSNLHVNKRVWVRFQAGSKTFGQVGGRYVIIGPSDLESDAVRYTIPGRSITIGPDGDYQPTLEFQRSRPGYSARAIQYVVANSSTTELAWALSDNGVTQTTMRLTKAGLLLQDNAGGGGSKYLGFAPTEGTDYVRFPGGTQVCWIRTQRTDVAIASAYGSMFQGTWQWNFPVAFNAIPTITCGRFQHGASASWGTVSGATSTYAVLRGIDILSRAAGTNVDIAAIAIGTWQ